MTRGVARGATVGALATLALGAQATSLPRLVTEVVDSNPLVREQVHVYRQTAQDHEIALSGWRPRLDLGASAGAVSREDADTGGRTRDFDRAQADVTLTQNLFDGFDTTHRIEQARARLSSAAYRLLDTADNVALDTVRAYLDVLSERRLVELAAQNVESHERIFSQIRELSDRGIIRRSDVEQTEGRLARARASLIAQQNNLEDALTELHRLIGRYVAAHELEESSLPPLPEEEIEGMIASALDANPAVRSARHNIEAARADYRRSRSSDLPTLDLEVQRSVGNDLGGPTGRTEEGSVMLNLRYNLYRGGADRARQRQKASVLHENKAFLDRVNRQVIDTLRLAWTADRALQQQLPWLERHSAKSLETVELYREEFLLYKRDLIDVLDAESELNRALQAEAEARYSAIAARYRVYEALGVLFDALGLGVDIGDDDLRVSAVSAAGVDSPELPADRDGDGVPDDDDQCDNTGAGAAIGPYGCERQPLLELGYDASEYGIEASDDAFTTRPGRALTLAPADLLANDKVSERDRPRIRELTRPAHGTIRRPEDDTITYTPDAGFVGEDRFAYTVSDRRGRRATANVDVSVQAPRREGLPESLRAYFAYKQETLEPESQRRVDALVDTLRERPEVRIEIVAHTDDVGSELYNLRLSTRRARAMRDMLITRGIAARRIDAIGAGESDPIADNSTEEGRALNRRVEFHFTPAAGE